ncbi:MAG: stage III sporulation protein AG [Clostridiaceae bacterium]|nr:stage III sporulation protein AG [Clostridiaceae bacterium]
MGGLKAQLVKYFTKKENIVNFAIILIVGIIIVIAGDSLFGNKTDKKENNAVSISEKKEAGRETEGDSYGEQLEKRLQDILSRIKGVGKVSVMITFESSIERIPALDISESQTITEESDSQGGSRKVTQLEKENKTILLNQQGNQQPLILKELQPKVKGVIVAAEGASDIQVKSNICEAVKTSLGIPAHKVQVFVAEN